MATQFYSAPAFDIKTLNKERAVVIIGDGDPISFDEAVDILSEEARTVTSSEKEVIAFRKSAWKHLMRGRKINLANQRLVIYCINQTN